MTAEDFTNQFSAFRPVLPKLLASLLEMRHEPFPPNQILSRLELPHSRLQDNVTVVDLGQVAQNTPAQVFHVPYRPAGLSGAWHADQFVVVAVSIATAAFAKTLGGDNISPGHIIFERIAQPSQPADRVSALLKSAVAFYSLNCGPSVPATAIGIRSGCVMPARRPVKITLLPAKDSANLQESGHKTIQVLGQMVASLCQITTRRTDPLQPARIVMNSVKSESSPSGVCVTLLAEVQCVHSSDIDPILRLVETTVEGVSRAFGTEFEMKLEPLKPGVTPDEQVTARFAEAARQVLGAANVVAVEFLRQELATVSHYLKRVPGCVLFLAQPTEIAPGKRDTNGDLLTILETGVKSLAWVLTRP